MIEKNELIKEVALYKSDKSSKALVIVTISVIIGCVLVSLFLWLDNKNKTSELEGRIVVVDSLGNSKIGSVSQVSSAEKKMMVAKNVLRLGVEYMYSFSDKNYDERLSKGIKYFGKSGKVILQGYHNDNVKRLVFQNSLRVYVVMNKIDVVYKNGKLVGEVIFEQSFINGNAVSKRSMKGSCSFIDAQLSDFNGYGLIIENWVVSELKNSDEQ